MEHLESQEQVVGLLFFILSSPLEARMCNNFIDAHEISRLISNLSSDSVRRQLKFLETSRALQPRSTRRIRLSESSCVTRLSRSFERFLDFACFLQLLEVQFGEQRYSSNGSR